MKKLIMLVALVLVVIHGVSNAGTSIIGAHNVKTIQALEV